MATVGSAIVCDRLRLYGNISLCDRMCSAIVCDRLRSYGNQSQIPVGPRSGREGEKCRPLDHMRQIPYINPALCTSNNGINFCIYSSIWYFILFYLILLASPTGRDTATACANYCGPGTRSQFCGGRKPEYPEETLEVRLRLTETQSTYNIVVEVEGVVTTLQLGTM